MKRIAHALTLAIVCAAGMLMSTEEARTESGSCFVGTTNGAIQGLDRGSSCAFLGIRFATSPVGGLRWTRPQPAASWAPATFNATVLPPACAQLSAANGQPTAVEDCLMLNIWTPNPLPASGAVPAAAP